MPTKHEDPKQEEPKQEEQKRSGAKADVPPGWKPDPAVIPGQETDPAGVMTLVSPKHGKQEREEK